MACRVAKLGDYRKKRIYVVEKLGNGWLNFVVGCSLHKSTDLHKIEKLLVLLSGVQSFIKKNAGSGNNSISFTRLTRFFVENYPFTTGHLPHYNLATDWHKLGDIHVQLCFLFFQMRPGNPSNPEAVAIAFPLAEIGEGIHAIRTGGYH